MHNLCIAKLLASRDEHLRKRLRCELAALVSIEYLRVTEFPERLFKRLSAERGVQRV